MKEKDLINALSSENELTSDGYSEASVSATGEASDVAVDFQRKKIERLNEEIEDLKQDRQQRKILSYCIFGFMCFYMLGTITIVILCGLCMMRLKESILITLLTTTLANVIGVFNFVAKYLYHKE